MSALFAIYVRKIAYMFKRKKLEIKKISGSKERKRRCAMRETNFIFLICISGKC